MSDFRGIHWAAAAAAAATIEDLSAALGNAAAAAEAALGQCRAAVGDSDMESGTNAVAYVAHVLEQLEQLRGAAASAHAEMIRYQGGF